MSAARQTAFRGAPDGASQGYRQGCFWWDLRREPFVRPHQPEDHQTPLAGGGYPTDNAANASNGGQATGRKSSFDTHFHRARLQRIRTLSSGWGTLSSSVETLVRRPKHGVDAMNAVLELRRRSDQILCGLPLYDIAFGPNLLSGDVFGRARGIIAIGDTASGWLAIGGAARGIVAIGGAAVGLIALGGGAIGVISVGGAAIGLLAIGGGAVGGIAIGGAALGVIAVGGCAVGYYACGAETWGQHVISAAKQSPEALKLFKAWIPWVR